MVRKMRFARTMECLMKYVSAAVLAEDLILPIHKEKEEALEEKESNDKPQL